MTSESGGLEQHEPLVIGIDSRDAVEADQRLAKLTRQAQHLERTLAGTKTALAQKQAAMKALSATTAAATAATSAQAAATTTAASATAASTAATVANTAATNAASAATVRQSALVNGLTTRLKAQYGAVNAVAMGMRGMAGAVLGVATALTVFQGVRGTISVIKEFNDTMAQVRAIAIKTTDAQELQEAQMKVLKDQAMQLGATTRFTATQAGEAQVFLARAGFKVKDIYTALPGVLDLAAAGFLEVGQAADIASNVLQQFNYSTEEMTRVADVLVHTSNNANTTVYQLAQALQYAGPIAAGLGIELEDLAAAVGALSNAGIQASIAGVQLRGIMVSLLTPTNEAQTILDRLARRLGDPKPFDVVNKSLVQIFRNFNKAGASVEDFAQLFERRQAAGAIILSDQIAMFERLYAITNDSAGAASKAAGILNSELGGAFDRLKAAIQSVAISLGEGGFASILKSLTHFMADFFQVLSGTIDKTRELNTVAVILAQTLRGILLLLAGMVASKIILGLIKLAKGLKNLAAAAALLDLTSIGKLAKIFAIIALALLDLKVDWGDVWQSMLFVMSSIVNAILGIFHGMVGTLEMLLNDWRNTVIDLLHWVNGIGILDALDIDIPEKVPSRTLDEIWSKAMSTDYTNWGNEPDKKPQGVLDILGDSERDAISKSTGLASEALDVILETTEALKKQTQAIKDRNIMYGQGEKYRMVMEAREKMIQEAMAQKAIVEKAVHEKFAPGSAEHLRGLAEAAAIVENAYKRSEEALKSFGVSFEDFKRAVNNQDADKAMEKATDTLKNLQDEIDSFAHDGTAREFHKAQLSFSREIADMLKGTATAHLDYLKMHDEFMAQWVEKWNTLQEAKRADQLREDSRAAAKDLDALIQKGREAVQLLGKSDVERDLFEAIKEASKAALTEGVGPLAEKIREYHGILLTLEAGEEHFKKLEQAAKDLERTAEDVGRALSSALHGFVLGSDSAIEAARNFISSLLDIIFTKFVADPLVDLIGTHLTQLMGQMNSTFTFGAQVAGASAVFQTGVAAAGANLISSASAAAAIMAAANATSGIGGIVGGSSPGGALAGAVKAIAPAVSVPAVGGVCGPGG